MPTPRYQVIAKMRGAFRRGISGSKFIADMKAKGLSYRRTDMLSDWRTINELETKKDAFQYVRKDYYAAKTAMAQVAWKLPKEYMYVFKVKSRITPDAPITERMVNVPTDRPITRREAEGLAWEMIRKQSPKRIGEVESVIGWSAMQRTI